MKMTVADFTLLNIMQGVPLTDGEYSIVRNGESYTLTGPRRTTLTVPLMEYRRVCNLWTGFRR